MMRQQRMESGDMTPWANFACLEYAAWLWKRKKGKDSLGMLVPADVFGFVFKYTPYSRTAAITTRALDEEAPRGLFIFFKRVLFKNVVYNISLNLIHCVL